MADVPNLSGIATEDLVDTIGTGSFSARYINWAKTLNLLHEHAPGWLPHIVHQENGEIVYGVADSSYVLIYFIHTDETSLPPVMQAVMDNRHKAIPFEKMTAVDVSNAVVRGYCKAAAVSFGLAYELWSGDQMESGYSTDEQKIVPTPGLKQEIKIAEESFDDTGRKEKIESDPLDLWPESPFIFVENWRDICIHFGKTNGPSKFPPNGKPLGDLSENQLSWYVKNYRPGYDKDGAKSNFAPTDVDMTLRHALTSSLQESVETVPPASKDDIPF